MDVEDYRSPHGMIEPQSTELPMLDVKNVVPLPRRSDAHRRLPQGRGVLPLHRGIFQTPPRCAHRLLGDTCSRATATAPMPNLLHGRVS